jgi:hypothetical protein
MCGLPIQNTFRVTGSACICVHGSIAVSEAKVLVIFAEDSITKRPSLFQDGWNLKDLFVPDVVTMIEESFVTEQASER